MRDIIAIDIKDDYLINNLGQSTPCDSLEHVLDFCITNKPNEQLVTVWNLFALLDVIRKLINEQEYKSLIETDKVWCGKGTRYKLFSSQGKRLCIGKETKLNGVSSKIESDVFNLNRYFPNYKPKDAIDIYNKGVELLKALDTMGMGDTDTLASAINIFNKSKLKDEFIPGIRDCPDALIDMTEYLMPLLARELRVVYKVGCWQGDHKATDCDIRAAYPSLVRNFGDLSDCKIWHSKTYQPCDFGVFKGYVTVSSDKSPIVDENKQPYKGRKLDFLTTHQWAYLKTSNKGTFEPIDGWMLKYNSDFKPFQKIMDDLYQQRLQGNSLISDISKSIANGLIGMFGQIYGEKYGEHFNPAYSVMATSLCSLKVAKKIDDLGIWDSIISIIVDGFLSTNQFTLDDDGKIGSWKSELVNSLTLSIGHAYTGSKHPENHSFEDMMLAIQSNPKLSSFNDVILSKELHTTNRQFDEFPSNGQDLLTKVYESKSIEVQE
jgi:hypothetical protein